jgi:predicted RNase H-like HicB family nuclease
MRYPIAIELGDADHAYGVIVPDLPGCFSAGDTLDEAIANTEEAIALFLEDYLDNDQAPPKPSKLEDLRARKDYKGMTWAVVPIDLAKLNTRSVRVNITIPDRVLAAIDSYVGKRGESRSGFLTRAAMETMADEAVEA